MAQRPIVGIATQTLEAIPGKLPHCWVMGQRYVRVLTSAGGLPWLIPLLSGDASTLRLIYDHLDAVFLTGGVDVDPSAYGEARHEMCDRCDPDRDEIEIQLIRWAMADHKPILGVCRGIQVINVACGGTLYQHLADQLPASDQARLFPTGTHFTRDHLAHSVQVEGTSRLGQLLESQTVQVNSMHHQGIKRLAADLRACAFAPDGLIEGVEGANRVSTTRIAVQWQPRNLLTPIAPQRRLFTDRLHRGCRAPRRFPPHPTAR